MHPSVRILPACVLLVGCLSPGETRLPGGTYQLQPTGDADAINEWQEIEVVHAKGTQKLLAHLLNTTTRTRLTVMDPTSLATLATCTYEHGTATLAGPLATAQSIPPELPLAILQLTTWPYNSAQRGLSGDLSLTTKGDCRVLKDSHSTLVEVETLPNRTRLIRLPRYETTIKVSPTSQP
jgi:hypothetical protein